MKKLLLFLLLGLSGCVSVSKSIRELPGYEFEEFKYASKTNVTSTTVHAVGGKIEEDVLTVDLVEINHNNPFFGLATSVKGLKRPARVDAVFSASPTGN